jgi:hypothetical protein
MTRSSIPLIKRLHIVVSDSQKPYRTSPHNSLKPGSGWRNAGIVAAVTATAIRSPMIALAKPRSPTVRRDGYHGSTKHAMSPETNANGVVIIVTSSYRPPALNTVVATCCSNTSDCDMQLIVMNREAVVVSTCILDQCMNHSAPTTIAAVVSTLETRNTVNTDQTPDSKDIAGGQRVGDGGKRSLADSKGPQSAGDSQYGVYGERKTGGLDSHIAKSEPTKQELQDGVGNDRECAPDGVP